MSTNRLWQSAAVFAVTAGFMCLFFSVFLNPKSTIFAVSLGLGVALLPAGLISIITAACSSTLIGDSLEIALQKTSKDLQSTIEGLKVTSTYLNTSRELGVVMVYGNRNQALRPFLNHLELYAGHKSPEGGEKKIVFVGSSLKGVIEDNPSLATQLERILELGKEECQFHFLLTHPQFSAFRENQEDRPAGGIAKEILHAIAWLEDRDIPRNNIRLYKGTPTNFMIASSERMLVNPYPYEREAYKCYCLELENNQSDESIFTSYWNNHYYRPWHGEQSRRDHYLKPNSLDYFHYSLDGPIPKEQSANTLNQVFADLFVISDSGSFYMAVNIRGLQSEIPYAIDPGQSHKLIRIGPKLDVRLLDLSDTPPQWEGIGSLELSDERDGFWQGTLRQTKALEAYSMVGVYDSEHTSPFAFPEGTALSGEPMPILWKKLPVNEQRSNSTPAPLLPNQQANP